MNKKLTYISSGMSFTRIIFPEMKTDPEMIAWGNSVFKTMQSNPNHDYGVLYNAWVEHRFGEVFKEHYKDNLAYIQADSGGLQIITQGKQITPELKKQIYLNQGTYSDMAMAFDEIPLAFNDSRSGRLDLSNRWFDKENFEEKARQTGRNIFEQLKTFEEIGSGTLPIFIVQGNCYDTYMTWTEQALSEIPKDYHNRIGGIAMGAAALGHGTLEDIQRAFIFTQLPIEQKNHMHLLAVGAVARMLPNMVFMQNGLYDGVHVTYDSTTHTSGVQMGNYYMNNGNYVFSRKFDRVKYGEIYRDVTSKFDIDVSLENFHEALNSKTMVYKERHGSRNGAIKSVMGACMSSITNFKNHIDECIDDKSKLLAFAEKYGKHGIFKTLYKVKTKDEFDYWLTHVGKYVTSKPVSSDKKQTLEEFFV